MSKVILGLKLRIEELLEAVTGPPAVVLESHWQ